MPNVSEKLGPGSARSEVASFWNLAVNEYTSLTLLALLSLAGLFLSRLFSPVYEDVDVPTVGFRSIFEPSFLVRFRFAKGALPQINEGYQKVLGTKSHQPLKNIVRVDWLLVQGFNLQDLQE